MRIIQHPNSPGHWAIVVRGPTITKNRNGDPTFSRNSSGTVAYRELVLDSYRSKEEAEKVMLNIRAALLGYPPVVESD